MNLVAHLRDAPNELVLVAICGLLLLYVELNRPGLIVPGATGLTLLLLCSAALLSLSWRSWGLTLLALSAALQLAGLRRAFHWSVGMVVALAVFLSLRGLLRNASDAPAIHVSVALCAAMILGPGTTILTAWAQRARRNKGLDS